MVNLLKTKGKKIVRLVREKLISCMGKMIRMIAEFSSDTRQDRKQQDDKSI